MNLASKETGSNLDLARVMDCQSVTRLMLGNVCTDCARVALLVGVHGCREVGGQVENWRNAPQNLHVRVHVQDRVELGQLPQAHFEPIEPKPAISISCGKLVACVAFAALQASGEGHGSVQMTSQCSSPGRPEHVSAVTCMSCGILHEDGLDVVRHDGRTPTTLTVCWTGSRRTRAPRSASSRPPRPP